MVNKLLQLFRSRNAKLPVAITPEFVQNSKAFCIFPWIHLHVTQLGTVTPCCQSPWDAAQSFGNINEQSVQEIWNGKAMCDFRKKMMADVPDTRCSRCYAKEAVGLRSLRQIFNHDYQHKLDWVNKTNANGYSAESKPIYWDIRFSNVCNFRCRICGPWSSSKWHKDAVSLGILPPDSPAFSVGVQDYNRLITQLEPFLPYIEEVYFAGGEPLFIDEHYRILKLLQDNNLYHVKLVYNTNFSVLEHKGFDILSVWSKFQQVFIAASLDDSYQRAELQRKEQNWQQTVNNRLLLLERCPNATFLITPTVSVFNVFNLPNFHKEWTEKGLVDAANFFPSMLSQPEIYNIRILPRSLKEQVAQIYSEHINWLKEQPTQYPNHKEVQLKDFKHCIDYMLSENWEHLIPQFKQRCAALDALRNESTADLFPELSILLD